MGDIDYDAMLKKAGKSPADNSARITEEQEKIQKIDAVLPMILEDRQKSNDVIVQLGGTPVPQIALPSAAPTSSSKTPATGLWNGVKSNSQPLIGASIGFGIGLILLILATAFISNIHGALVLILVIVWILATIGGLAIGIGRKQAKETNRTTAITS